MDMVRRAYLQASEELRSLVQVPAFDASYRTLHGLLLLPMPETFYAFNSWIPQTMWRTSR